MRSQRCWLVLLGVLLGINLLAAAPPESAEIDRLVRQLGSERHEERETATQGLDGIGAPALGSLRQASKSDDVEIRRRARELVRVIERRVEQEQLLEPTRLHLQYRDQPLKDVLDQLSKRTGYEITLQGEPAFFAGRKVTLETPQLPFWEAVDRLSVSAGITLQPASLPNLAAGRDPNQPFQSGAVPVPDMRRVIVLADGQPPFHPTWYAGAVRLRAIPAGDQAVRDKNEAIITFDIAVEPKLQWRGLTAVLVDKAVDEKDQALTQLALEEMPIARDQTGAVWVMPAQGANAAGKQVIVRGNVAFVQERSATSPGATPAQIRLKLPDNGAKTLKLLKGVMVAQVETPPQPSIVIDDVQQAVGKNFTGKDGAEMKVLDVRKVEGGMVTVQIEMTQPVSQEQWRGVAANRLAAIGITLHDADGQEYDATATPSSVRRVRFNGRNGVMTRQQQIVFRPKNANAVPKKLTYSASRETSIEVPFEFKDVPLP